MMWTRLAVGLLLAIVAYAVVRYFSTDDSREAYTNWDSVVETPSYASPVREPPVMGDMNVAAGGPNSPNVAAPRRMPTTVGVSPSASDPFDETAEDADHPDRLRHPERSFSPGVVPEGTAIAQAAGLAGPTAASAQAFQQFSPDYVQNGGTFFGNVSAQEDENPNYTAF